MLTRITLAICVCFHPWFGMQELKELREQIKAKMAACLTELRNMQYLEDMLEAAEVNPRRTQSFSLQASTLLSSLLPISLSGMHFGMMHALTHIVIGQSCP